LLDILLNLAYFRILTGLLFMDIAYRVKVSLQNRNLEALIKDAIHYVLHSGIIELVSNLSIPTKGLKRSLMILIDSRTENASKVIFLKDWLFQMG